MWTNKQIENTLSNGRREKDAQREEDGGTVGCCGCCFFIWRSQRSPHLGFGLDFTQLQRLTSSPLPPIPVAIYPRSCKRFLEDGIRVFEDLWWDLIRVTF